MKPAPLLALVLALAAFGNAALPADPVPQGARATLSAGGMMGVPISVAPETLFHTLVADFSLQGDGTIYVQTGDIPAMWLRDAAAQTLPYVRLARVRPQLKSWIRAVVEREARNIDVDPYANAFRADYRVWERKWEVDSLAYPVLLAWTYEAQHADRRLFTPSLHKALIRIVATYDCERRHARCSHYRFAGTGTAAASPVPETGLIWTAFRASDDATMYPYNIPDQMLAASALRDLADLARHDYRDRALAARAVEIATGLDGAIARFGVTYDFRCGGRVYAYEVDGRGRQAFFDDANIPSLLGAPLAGYLSFQDPLYLRTRACVLSGANRYFYRGAFAAGVGSPHTPRGFVWPLALIARALTSGSRSEVLEQLNALSRSSSSSGLIHESFDPNNPTRFTREEFGWGNAMYAELLFRAAADFPAQAVAAPPPGMTPQLLPASIAVVDAATALENRGALLDAFDRAVPFGVTGSDE